ncbi:DUF2577 domain-containing protein [Anaerotignum sp.]|uniref:DUF2577 domain-containing protein n=1 Tax=Anaerotignum sp. TaxID=2039241 RepID=UPI002A90ED21|nr:DUF2577 domain-containing protein [Anaerotignum sp.]MCI7657300.1 DUF2577 domain-containing protein [Clostridia bacterium]MDY5415524.1 DUF2577 domain-containing protein [Anaerotignum sp.]
MVELLKEIALEAVDRGSLADFCTGTVIAAAPLSIQIENGPLLAERFLLLSRNVTEHEELGQIRTWTEAEGDRWSFYRMIRGKALQAGEKVLLAKTAGGQQYIVLDRVKGGGQ